MNLKTLKQKLTKVYEYNRKHTSSKYPTIMLKLIGEHYVKYATLPASEYKELKRKYFLNEDLLEVKLAESHDDDITCGLMLLRLYYKYSYSMISLVTELEVNDTTIRNLMENAFDKCILPNFEDSIKEYFKKNSNEENKIPTKREQTLKKYEKIFNYYEELKKTRKVLDEYPMNFLMDEDMYPPLSKALPEEKSELSDYVYSNNNDLIEEYAYKLLETPNLRVSMIVTAYSLLMKHKYGIRYSELADLVGVSTSIITSNKYGVKHRFKMTYTNKFISCYLAEIEKRESVKDFTLPKPTKGVSKKSATVKEIYVRETLLDSVDGLTCKSYVDYYELVYNLRLVDMRRRYSAGYYNKGINIVGWSVTLRHVTNRGRTCHLLMSGGQQQMYKDAMLKLAGYENEPIRYTLDNIGKVIPGLSGFIKDNNLVKIGE